MPRLLHERQWYLRRAMDLRDKDSQPSTTADAVERTELSEREREILILVATGASNKLIARQLDISPNTVKVHLRNIFGKVGVASRTEAALYAIRAGLVPSPAGATEAPEAPPEPALPGVEAAPVAKGRRAGARHPAVWATGLLVAAVVLVAAAVFTEKALAPTPSPTFPPATPMPRWSSRAPMPTARSGLAVAVFENRLYAIGGEAQAGVTGLVERFSPDTNSWTALTSKAQPVTDAAAAVVGGLIYVPGGRTATGDVTTQMEVYDPKRDQWETRTAMPAALSGYALAVLEGKLYVFGGWDGRRYVASTYEYNPDTDAWRERTPMPTARAFAGAAVAEGRIHVIGGQDDNGPLAVNEAYTPAKDAAQAEAWQTLAPLPDARSHVAALGVPGFIHVIGGVAAEPSRPPLLYDETSDLWQAFEAPPSKSIAEASGAVLGSGIEVLGGRTATGLSNQHLRYQVLYVISQPAVSP
jgi:DNA-binding CsgD family transcriptional regulator